MFDRERLHEGLGKFDPLEHAPLLSVFDPYSRPDRREALHPIWLVTPFLKIFFALVLVVLVLVLTDIPALGRDFWGATGLLRDFGAWHQYFGFALWWCTVIVGRRVLGSMICELERTGVVGPYQPDSNYQSRYRLLNAAEYLTRLRGWQGVLWLIVIVAGSASVFCMFLGDDIQNWISTPATPGTLFYFFAIGNEQPHVAGIISVLVIGFLNNYVVLLSARLFIVLAMVCSELSDRSDLSILPPHPDHTGGLLPIGRASLYFSLFTFQTGLALVINLMQSYVRQVAAGREFTFNTDNVPATLFWLGIYLVAGPLLFVSPLWPLRRQMRAAKVRFLWLLDQDLRHIADRMRRASEPPRLDISDADAFGKLQALHVFADEMAVWPYDRRTFLRFFGVLVSPFLPLLAARLSWLGDVFMSFLIP